tara:strand:+ start:9641 stop:10117 length:477 start_codon:yes stop_codon:yes gene_type:complete
MLCEMCGIEVANPILSKISGTILRTCQKCSAMGVEATEREKIGNKNYISDVMNKRSNRLREKEIKTEKILVEDFGILIKNGRENKKWSQKELASKISEKKSTIASIENKQYKPEKKLINKLETVLEIRLMEEIEVKDSVKTSETTGMTLADLIEKSNG